MARTRSASREDEVVTPSSRQASLRSVDNSQLRRSTRNKGKTASKRSHDDEDDYELEASPPPKKSRYPKRDIIDPRSSKKPTARKLFTHNNTSGDHLGNSPPSTPHKDRLPLFPSLPGSPQMINTGKPPANADLVKWMSQWNTADDKPKTIFDLGHIVRPSSGLVYRDISLFKTRISFLRSSLDSLAIFGSKTYSAQLQDVLGRLLEDKDVLNFARTAKKSYYGSFTIGLINDRFSQIFEEFAVERKEKEDDETYYERRLKEIKAFYTTAQGLNHRQVLFSSWGNDAVKDQDLCANILKVLMTSKSTFCDIMYK